MEGASRSAVREQQTVLQYFSLLLTAPLWRPATAQRLRGNARSESAEARGAVARGYSCAAGGAFEPSSVEVTAANERVMWVGIPAIGEQPRAIACAAALFAAPRRFDFAGDKREVASVRWGNCGTWIGKEQPVGGEGAFKQESASTRYQAVTHRRRPDPPRDVDSMSRYLTLNEALTLSARRAPRNG